ncbi:MAG: M23 family metallopeptidase [Bacteroidales bacterium]|jgi:hypothetical protein|nr:M23 family metallopeptidase [Bacteroidales bacterium]
MRQIILFIVVFGVAVGVKAQFDFPLRLKPEMAGSFGELRGDHFHGGVDYRTNQKERYAVRAMDKGKIVRVSVTKKGYGKALYIQYDNGLMSVYGHLRKFSCRINKLVREQMRHSGDSGINIVNLDIPVKRKQKVGLSGNTGSSAGPHLHLEFRSHYLTPADKIMLYNPQKYFSVTDNIAPKFYAFGVYRIKRSFDTVFVFSDTSAGVGVGVGVGVGASMDTSSGAGVGADMDTSSGAGAGVGAGGNLVIDTVPVVSNMSSKDTGVEQQKQAVPVVSKMPSKDVWYYVQGSFPDTLFLHLGWYGFGLSALDSMDQEPFHYGLYRLCFMINDDTVSYYSLDSLSLSATSKIAHHVDSEFYRKYKKRMEKSWIMPDSAALSPYSVTHNNGTYFLQPDTTCLLTIIGSDFNGNTTILRQPIKTYKRRPSR